MWNLYEFEKMSQTGVRHLIVKTNVQPEKNLK